MCGEAVVVGSGPSGLGLSSLVASQIRPWHDSFLIGRSQDAYRCGSGLFFLPLSSLNGGTYILQQDMYLSGDDYDRKRCAHRNID